VIGFGAGVFCFFAVDLLKKGAVVVAFSGAATWIILKAIDLVIGIRVPESEEVLGLDTTQHGELAYQL
jgi:Amt family ammonium transporter